MGEGVDKPHVLRKTIAVRERSERQGSEFSALCAPDSPTNKDTPMCQGRVYWNLIWVLWIENVLLGGSIGKVWAEVGGDTRGPATIWTWEKGVRIFLGISAYISLRLRIFHWRSRDGMERERKGAVAVGSVTVRQWGRQAAADFLNQRSWQVNAWRFVKKIDKNFEEVN